MVFGGKITLFFANTESLSPFYAFLYVFVVLSPMLVPLEPLIAFRKLTNFEDIFWICHANKLLLYVES